MQAPQVASLPPHIAAILAGKVRAVAVAPVVQARDKRPVFTPAQSGSLHAVRSVASIIDDAGELECHDDMTLQGNDEGDIYSLSSVGE